MQDKIAEQNTEVTIRNKFTLITFSLSLLVISIHTYNLSVYGIDASSGGFSHLIYLLESFCNQMESNAVPFFFFVSAVLFFRTFEISRLFLKWKSRFFSVVLPYLIWCSIYYFYYVFCTNVPFIRGLMNGNEVVSFSLSEWGAWLWTKAYFTLWFLQDLIVMIAMAPLIWLLLKNHFKKIPTGFVALIALEIWLIYFASGVPAQGSLEYYLVGAYIGLNCREWFGLRSKWFSIAGCAVLLILALTGFRQTDLIAKLLFFFSVWFAIDLLPLREKALPWWMSITFFVYVSHSMLLEAMEKIFLKAFGRAPIFALLDYCLMPIAVYLILIFVAWVLRKYLPVLWKVLSGGRA